MNNENYYIASITYFKETGVYTIARKNYVTGDGHITNVNHLTEAEEFFIKSSMPPYEGSRIIQWV